MLLNNFLHNIGIWKNKKICVGLSGGVDSVVLLHLLSRVSTQRLSAVYVHHGLNDEADNWQQFCQTYCERLGVDFCAVRVHVNPEKQGIEAAARQERYEVFEQQNCDVIALAHHADDQVETFLLAALRGGGLRALSAMPFERIFFKNKWLIRPMLIFSREQIEQYAQQHHLDYVQDDSNFDTTLRRNFIRQVWLPKIREYLPNYQKQILTSVATLQDELALLNEVIQQDWHAKYGARCLKSDNSIFCMSLCCAIIWVCHAEQVLLILLRFYGKDKVNGRCPKAKQLHGEMFYLRCQMIFKLMIVSLKIFQAAFA